ncbi:hypothetical protein Tco_1004616 [Tanacetum coccineum]|uniref:Uncharacterized protein n=1 Tax=Tanacetum coccineum TaxID=301880 RepID=A0ABQ5FDV2_9ASTR
MKYNVSMKITFPEYAQNSSKTTTRLEKRVSSESLLELNSSKKRMEKDHSSCGDTESYYQSSRSRGTEPAPKRHHDRKAYSRKGGKMSESEDSAGGHWKSKSKK